MLISGEQMASLGFCSIMLQNIETSIFINSEEIYLKARRTDNNIQII
jgi:hypothetical protein